MNYIILSFHLFDVTIIFEHTTFAFSDLSNQIYKNVNIKYNIS